MTLGLGEWDVYIASRGGGSIRHQVRYGSLNIRRILNETGDTQVSIPISPENSEVFSDTEPWRDELLIYRSGKVAFVGPIVHMEMNPEGIDVQARDLFYWMEMRFIAEDQVYDADVSHIFAGVLEKAIASEPSIDLGFSVRPTGVTATRSFQKEEFTRVADVLRELSRTALDFTTIGRQVVAGGLEVFLDQEKLIIHDDGVARINVIKDGESLATDVGVFGATEFINRPPVFGRATRNIDIYGLVQKQFTELLIRDNISARANALSTLVAMQPSPLRVEVVLTPEAAVTLESLDPGKRVDVRLAEPLAISEEMRLIEVIVDVPQGEGAREEVSLQLIPLGLSDA